MGSEVCELLILTQFCSYINTNCDHILTKTINKSLLKYMELIKKNNKLLICIVNLKYLKNLIYNKNNAKIFKFIVITNYYCFY